MTKRGPGRPKVRPDPKGLGRTELADRLGVGVKTVDKWLREGVPVAERRDGRVYFDVAAVEAWREDFEAQPKAPAVAPRLHPSDVRYVERSKAAEIRSLNFATKTGAAIHVDDLNRVFADSVTVLNARLNAVPSMVGNYILEHDNAAAILTPIANELADGIDFDKLERWPEPAPFVSDEAEPDPFADTEFDGDSLYKPVLPAADPQAQFAAAKVREHDSILGGLRDNLIAHGDAMRILSELADDMRAVVRKLPARVAKRLREGDSPGFADAVLMFEIERTKADCIECVPGAKCEWRARLEAPRRDNDKCGLESITEDVDGDPDLES